VCCSDRYVIVKWHDVLFVCVCMPCKGTANYQDSYCNTLADISAVIRDNAHRWLILGSDLNLDFTYFGPLHDCIFEFASCCKLQLTHNLLPSL